jgi:hypothetical protein
MFDFLERAIKPYLTLCRPSFFKAYNKTQIDDLGLSRYIFEFAI